MTDSQVFKAWYMLLSLSCTIIAVSDSHAQQLRDIIEYSVVPSCDSPDPNKPTELNKYYLELGIDALSVSEGDFEIDVDGVSILQFHLTQEDVPYKRLVGPFNHSGVGGSFHEYIIRSLEDGATDTLYLPELVCALSTSNGLNRAGYYCDQGNYGVVAQTTPEGLSVPQMPEKTYVYVLIESTTQLVVDRNFSGHFDGVMDLTDYEVHAFAVSFDMQADFINNIVIGTPLDQNDLDICYALCGVFEVAVDCSSFDMSLTKTVRGDFVYSIGDIVIFDITVHNDGLVTAYNIVVEDMKPDALEYVVGMNPHWAPDLTSYPIDSIEPGNSVTIPIYMRVSSLGTSVAIINSAEIIFAASDPDSDVPAFDIDSTVDNEDSSEDDQDDDEIIVLENLCAATFAVDAENDAVCLDGPLIMRADVTMATYPVSYTWRFEGEIVSRDSIHVIEDHQPSDYGNYSLTIIDGNSCSGTIHFTIEPIEDQIRFACYTDINVAVNSNCEVFLRPDMLTSRDISGINDYILEIRDSDNNRVDLSDLSTYGPGTILEARIINPCTLETICWSNLHIEHKLVPDFDIYDNERFVTMCPQIYSQDPTVIINEYNSRYGDLIFDEQTYADSFNQLTCLQEWDIEVIDVFSQAPDVCSERSIFRIYNIYNQELRLPIDTAVLYIQPITADSIRMPDDIFNITCDEGLTPQELLSFPSFYNEGMPHSLEHTFANQSATFCNIGISYSDLDLGEVCSFGTSKIVRRWTATDWCSNSYIEDLQYLFIVDKEAPVLAHEEEPHIITTAPFDCFAVIDIYDYLVVSDGCDSDPIVTVNGEADLHRIILLIGAHDIEVTAEDKCGNNVTRTLHFLVSEYTPPIAILKEDIVISLSTDTFAETNYVVADAIDAGSHDYDCGPVSLTIARSAEVLLVASEGGSVQVDFDLRNCMHGLGSLDENTDGLVTRSELFRERIVFCCQDIGSIVRLTVKVVDESGNVTEAEVSIAVEAKLEWTPCDDLDPCTQDDRSYGDCPCSGTPVIEDFDGDLIVDCIDDVITVCLDGVQKDIIPSELPGYIENGATGGACISEGKMATVAGEVFTAAGDMIEDVAVTLNESKEYTTSTEGYYRFDQNEMYQRYELYPERDDDPLNGVSTVDLVMLQEYILGLRSINDPYLLIAGDVNSDGKITALDIVALRKVILGINDRFTNNRSWRFVIEQFEFDDIRHPYNYQETNVISSLDADMMDENWVGIKIGDLNITAQANSLKSNIRSGNKWYLSVPNISVKEGDDIRLPISAGSSMEALGMQLGLILNGLTFQSLRSAQLSISSDQYTVDQDGSDALRIVWHDSHPIKLEDQLFYVSLKASRSGHLKDMITLDESWRKSLLATPDYEELPIDLEFSEGMTIPEAPAATLYQNQPNPFNGETIIQFSIPASGEVKMVFYDGNGKLLYDIANHYNEGVNAIRLTHSDLSLFEGVVYYQMSYEDQLLSRKMVIAK